MRRPGKRRPGKRRPGKRRRRPALGSLRKSMNLRWDVGAPLMILGALVAGLVLGASGGGFLFWGGVLVTGVGLACFLEGP